MRWLNGIMPRLVSFLAIRSWRDLILKPIPFLVLFQILGLPIDYLRFSTEDRPSPFASLWVITLLSTPVLVLQFAVVTYLDRLQRKLAHLAMTDVMTGLPNRRSFLKRTENLRQLHPDGTVFILDADHFKRINDTYGHATGDACLQAVAQKLMQSVTPDDVLGRLGGEEFAAYLPNATDARIRQFGDQLTKQTRVEIDTTSQATSQHVHLTLSIGAASAEPGKTIDILLSRADLALYEAKEKGRGRMVVWDDMLEAAKDAG